MKESKDSAIKDDGKCGSVCFVLWVILGICIFLIIVNDDAIIKYTDAHPGMASWVQAIGSIVALYATAYIARIDGLHRKNEEIRRDRAEIREIKFHLFKTSFWNAFNTYILIYKNFSTFEGKSTDTKEYNVLFVLLNTNRHFEHLYEQFARMSDEDKYILQLSEAGEDFTTLFSTLNMINNRYEVFINIATESLGYEKGTSFSKLVKNNNAQSLDWENNDLKDVKKTLDDTLVILSSIYSNISRKLFSGTTQL
ncbi:hypothetical protein [Comamonas thiooxydans]|uniref:hypothetical protein n=1 Tax=Comamonas thiooxydans TaxID=363952 RepID=UPI00118657A0|nr:hypothetical protein [Comamonas thiooxydans]BDB69098.1 hypothetical protein Cthiooxydans_15100 [Comamonas thiooxydans]